MTDQAINLFAYYGITTLEDEREAETMAGDALLTIEETEELGHLESVIHRKLQGFIEVGNALVDIRDKRLYRESFGTFEEYCQGRWGFGRTFAFYQIESAKVMNNLSVHNCEQKPTNEAQARPLTQLPVEDQPAAWQHAVDTAPNGKVTGAHVETTVRDWLKKDDPVIEAESPESQNGNGMSQPLAVLLSHEATEWYTPKPYIEAARAVMGSIDLDPASSAKAQETVRAVNYFTVDDDGLSHPWCGNVWLNPPYSTTDGKSNQDLWAQYLIEQYRIGNVTEAILLVKSSLGYNWFERIWDQFPVCFARELISFVKPGTPESGKAKLGSAFFYLGPNLPRFTDVFGRLGRIVTPKGETL